MKETVGGLGTGAKGLAKTVGHGTAGVVGGVGKGVFTGGKLIANGGVDLVTGVGDFAKE